MMQLAGKQATLLRGPRLPQMHTRPIRGVRPIRAAAAELEASTPAPIVRYMIDYEIIVLFYQCIITMKISGFHLT